MTLRHLPVLLVVAAGVAAPATAQSREDLARQVRDAEARFAQSMANRDFAAFSRYVAEEAVFFDEDTAQRGKAAVLAAWRPFFDGPTAPFGWRPAVVEVLASGTLALSSGPVLDADGNEVGTFNSIWRLEPDGGWRVIFDKGCPVCSCGGATSPDGG